MRVRRAEREKRDKLFGFTNGIHRFEPAEDADGEYIFGDQCLTEPAFASIRSELLAFAEIDSNPQPDISHYYEPPLASRIDLANLTPGTLAAQINALIAGSSAVEIVVPKGTWNCETEILVPNSKSVIFRGEAGAILALTSTTPGASLFRLQNANNSWLGKFIVTDLSLRARAAALQTCFSTDQSVRVNHNAIRLENLELSSNHYNIYFNNMHYCIAPTFRNLRGTHGIYWSGGETHSASNLLIENCRFHSGTRGPEIFINGARDWMLRGNICEGSSDLDADIDPDAWNVLHTRGVLITNPGPVNGFIEAQWCEFWGLEANNQWEMTIDYNFNNGGVNKPGTYEIRSSTINRCKFLNSSTTDAMNIHIYGAGLTLPDWSNQEKIIITGKTKVTVFGGMLNNGYKFDHPDVLINGCAIGPDNEHLSYQDTPAEIYSYQGGTGIYERGATAGSWSLCRPYVQHHPTYGHSLVFASSTRLHGSAFLAPMPPFNSGKKPVQEVFVCAPHLAATGVNPTGGNTFGFGVAGSMGYRFNFQDGHVPTRQVGKADPKTTGTTRFFELQSGSANSGKWLQCFAGTAWRGVFGESKRPKANYDCYEWPNESGPPLGTSIIGDICRKIAIADIGQYWLCTEAGTSRPISVTGNTTSGQPTLTSVSDITELLVGDFIDIAGATGVYRITDIAGSTVTLSANATATLTGAAVTNHAPTWTAKP